MAFCHDPVRRTVGPGSAAEIFLSVQGTAADPEQARGAALVPAGELQHPLDVQFFQVPEVRGSRLPVDRDLRGPGAERGRKGGLRSVVQEVRNDAGRSDGGAEQNGERAGGCGSDFLVSAKGEVAISAQPSAESREPESREPES